MANISISNYKQLVQTNTTNATRCDAMRRHVAEKLKYLPKAATTATGNWQLATATGQRQQLCCKLRLSVPKASTIEGPKLAHPFAYCCPRATRRMRNFVFIADSIRAAQQTDGTGRGLKTIDKATR